MRLVAYSYGVTLAWLIGSTIFFLVLGPGALASGRVLALSLSLGIGLLATALQRYGLQLIGATAPWAIVLADHVLLAALLVVALRVRRRWKAPAGSARETRLRARWQRWVCLAIVLGLLVLALRIVQEGFLDHPFGRWDAIGTWNVKARALHAGHERWIELLETTGFPDYPLLLPATVARLWAYAGGFSPLIPQWTAIVLLLGLSGVLLGALLEDRGPWVAVTALAVALSAHPFLRWSSSQYADLPVAAFLLATLVCLARSVVSRSHAAGYGLLAGAFAAGAAWTKNDGLPLLLAGTGAVALMAVVPGRTAEGRARRARSARRLLGWCLGALPAVLALAHQKAVVSAEPWLVGNRAVADVVSLLLHGERYRRIWVVFGLKARTYLTPEVALLWGLTVLLVPPRATRDFVAGWGVACALLLVQLMVYSLIYLVTPYNLTWHLLTSVGRLEVQVWPAVVWLAFLLIDPERWLRPLAARESTSARAVEG